MLRIYYILPDAGCVCKMERAYPEGDYSSFSGCLFVAGNVSEVASLASLQKAAILVDNEGKSLSIEAGKAELPAKFAQLLKL